MSHHNFLYVYIEYKEGVETNIFSYFFCLSAQKTTSLYLKGSWWFHFFYTKLKHLNWMDNFCYMSWHWEQVRLSLTRYLFSLLSQLQAVKPETFLKLWDWKSAAVWVSPPTSLSDYFQLRLFFFALVSSSKYLLCLLLFRLSRFTVPLSFFCLFCYSSS